MMGGRSWDEWIEEYSHSHEHPVNRITHSFGIPMIVLSSASSLGTAPEGWSTNMRHIVAEKSGHWIHLDQPELVVQAVRDLIV